MDVLAGSRRSALMRKVGCKNTKPELEVRRLLHGMGFRFRLHRKDLPGCPDLVLPKWHTAVFVHGCFWHGCTRCDKGLRKPKTNSEFWERKINSNVERDLRVGKLLADMGWKVTTVWECDLKELAALRDRLFEELVRYGSIDVVR